MILQKSMRGKLRYLITEVNAVWAKSYKDKTRSTVNIASEDCYINGIGFIVKVVVWHKMFYKSSIVYSEM